MPKILFSHGFSPHRQFLKATDLGGKMGLKSTIFATGDSMWCGFGISENPPDEKGIETE
jgi:hypothetical protein